MSRPGPMKPIYFASPADLRAWFDAHHASAEELWIGFHKTSTGRPSVTWPQSVDEALCVGWIDGLRRSLGAEAYAIRFTPRRARGIWSAVNIRKFAALMAAGRVKPAGLKAFARRDEKRSRVYSYERASAALAPEQERAIRAEKKAWDFFTARSASYRRAACWWVVGAKREETRLRRMKILISDCAAGRLIKHLRRP